MLLALNPRQLNMTSTSCDPHFYQCKTEMNIFTYQVHLDLIERFVKLTIGLGYRFMALSPSAVVGFEVTADRVLKDSADLDKLWWISKARCT